VGLRRLGRRGLALTPSTQHQPTRRLRGLTSRPASRRSTAAARSPPLRERLASTRVQFHRPGLRPGSLTGPRAHPGGPGLGLVPEPGERSARDHLTAVGRREQQGGMDTALMGRLSWLATGRASTPRVPHGPDRAYSDAVCPEVHGGVWNWRCAEDDGGASLSALTLVADELRASGQRADCRVDLRRQPVTHQLSRTCASEALLLFCAFQPGTIGRRKRLTFLPLERGDPSVARGKARSILGATELVCMQALGAAQRSIDWLGLLTLRYVPSVGPRGASGTSTPPRLIAPRSVLSLGCVTRSGMPVAVVSRASCGAARGLGISPRHVTRTMILDDESSGRDASRRGRDHRPASGSRSSRHWPIDSGISGRTSTMIRTVHRRDAGLHWLFLGHMVALCRDCRRRTRADFTGVVRAPCR
jgi:hypothetical protein